MKLRLKPSNPVARSSTWSQYKQSNTATILLAMSPQKLTTFVSDSYGGRTSNKHLICCGILKKLLTGDVVLAD